MPPLAARRRALRLTPPCAARSSATTTTKPASPQPTPSSVRPAATLSDSPNPQAARPFRRPSVRSSPESATTPSTRAAPVSSSPPPPTRLHIPQRAATRQLRIHPIRTRNSNRPGRPPHPPGHPRNRAQPFRPTASPDPLTLGVRSAGARPAKRKNLLLHAKLPSHR